MTTPERYFQLEQYLLDMQEHVTNALGALPAALASTDPHQIGLMPLFLGQMMGTQSKITQWVSAEFYPHPDTGIE